MLKLHFFINNILYTEITIGYKITKQIPAWKMSVTNLLLLHDAMLKVKKIDHFFLPL